MALVARRCFVSGRVQGVFFRASTRQQAGELGVSGHAKNLPDGRVEVLIVGEPGATDVLVEWLHRGPPSARVDAVESHALELDELDGIPEGFSTR